MVVNLPPVAVAAADPESSCAPVLVQFDGTQSYDPEGRPLSYFWDFGECCDYLQERSPVYLYSLPETYDVQLKVTDDVGWYHYAFLTIQVE